MRNTITLIDRSLNEHGVLILDGGLATALEARGHDIDDPLWSARVLLDAPQAIRQLHEDYLSAGADCVITASYQATFAGLEARGLSRTEAAKVFQRSVALACQARDTFWTRSGGRDGRPRPLVAASIGPYGAYLNDGSEYRGDYGLSAEDLRAFHRPRFDLLANSAADLLACETIPCLAEAQALVQLLHAHPHIGAWFSFTCKDDKHVSHGEPIRACGELLNHEPQVVAIGVNCTAPNLVLPLIGELAQVTSKPIVVYPNSGEQWDAERKIWTGSKESADFVDQAARWQAAGASLIGGCCRTGPEHIEKLAARLRPAAS